MENVTLGELSQTTLGSQSDPTPSRLTKARDLLISAQKGQNLKFASTAGAEGATAILIRYRRAAEEGASDHNLNLLAQAATTLLQKEIPRAETFLALADVLTVVTPDEMEVVATLYEYVNDCGILLSDRVKRCAGAQRRTVEALVPRVFATEDQLRGVAAGLVRTGLVELMVVYGKVLYAPSALADRLNEVIPLGACGVGNEPTKAGQEDPLRAQA